MPAQSRMMAKRASRSSVLRFGALAAVSAWAWWGSSSTLAADSSFVGGAGAASPSAGAALARAPAVSRRAFTWEVKESKEYVDLDTKPSDKGIRISTKATSMQGHWNTVLGDKEIPATGRTYWEVKIVSKPCDAWEYIGVAEASSDVTMPLTRNKKGHGWFWGATLSESFLYRFLESKKEFKEQNAKRIDLLEEDVKLYGNVPDKKKKDIRASVEDFLGPAWSTPGAHVGTIASLMPPFKTGMVVGVDVDMDAGTVSFWADGKYLGPMRDIGTNKPLSLKGKKVVPALSIFGRKMPGVRGEHTIMELRTGLEPPPLPSK